MEQHYAIHWRVYSFETGKVEAKSTVVHDAEGMNLALEIARRIDPLAYAVALPMGSTVQVRDVEYPAGWGPAIDTTSDCPSVAADQRQLPPVGDSVVNDIGTMILKRKIRRK